MATLGEQLDVQARQRFLDALENQRDQIRKFFTETLYGEVQAALAENRDPNPLPAPPDINYLFFEPHHTYRPSFNPTNTHFGEVYREVEQFMREHGLGFQTGIRFWRKQDSKPWDQLPWGAAAFPKFFPPADSVRLTDDDLNRPWHKPAPPRSLPRETAIKENGYSTFSKVVLVSSIPAAVIIWVIALLTLG